MNKRTVLNYVVLLLALLLLSAAACKVTDPDGNGNGNGGDDEPVHYYVSPNGSDANDGSSGSPWLTIQHGLDNLAAGNTLNIRAGTYNETLRLNRSGAENNKIYIKGQSFDTVILLGDSVDRDLFFVEYSHHIDISGLTIARAPRAGLRLSHSDHVRISNCVFAENGRWGVFTDFSDNTMITNCEALGSQAEHGIYISNSSDNVTIRNSIVHHNHASGIQINADPSMGDDGISSGCLIENNLIYENGWGGGAAVNLASVRDSVIQNNIIYYNYAGGIAAWDDGQGLQWGCQGLTIIHNTVYFRPLEGRWALSLKNGSTGARIYNNILSGGLMGGFEFNTNCLTDIQIDHNIYYRVGSNRVVTSEDTEFYTLTQWQWARFDLNSASHRPRDLFQSYTGGDFHILGSSWARDHGTDVGLTYDFEGDTRPAGGEPDIGADETE